MRGEDEGNAADLRWYFRDSDGDMGLKSNFGAMVAAISRTAGSGGSWSRPADAEEIEYAHVHSRKLLSGEDYDMDLRLLEAAKRAREVKKSLEACDVWARCVLGVAFRYADGERLLLAATSAATQAYKRSKSRRTLAEWLERRRKSKKDADRREWSLLREGMLNILSDALAEYARARRLALGRGSCANS